MRVSSAAPCQSSDAFAVPIREDAPPAGTIPAPGRRPPYPRTRPILLLPWGVDSGRGSEWDGSPCGARCCT
ncbi:hypothetical protein GCM10009772_40560 [Pseudonocardia alni subsp. carboxydivorans]